MRQLCFILTLALPATVFAQGDGPRSWTPKPIGTHVLVPMYLHFDSNFNFQQTILVKDADVQSDVGILTYLQVFDLAGRSAEFRATAIWGSVSGDVELPDPVRGQSTFEIPRQSGIADPVFSFRLGLFGAPALTLQELMETPPSFQGSFLISAAAPIGDYDSDRLFNLGTNRWAIRLGLPMVVPLASPASQTFLEIIPSVTLFTDNTDPTAGAELREQDPLFIVESHLSRNFTPKLWGSLDLRGQWGGETSEDGVPDDNRLAQLGGGGTLGYQLTPAFSFYASYGGIFLKNDDSRGTMFRVQAALAF